MLFLAILKSLWASQNKKFLSLLQGVFPPSTMRVNLTYWSYSYKDMGLILISYVILMWEGLLGNFSFSHTRGWNSHMSPISTIDLFSFEHRNSLLHFRWRLSLLIEIRDKIIFSPYVAYNKENNPCFSTLSVFTHAPLSFFLLFSLRYSSLFFLFFFFFFSLRYSHQNQTHTHTHIWNYDCIYIWNYIFYLFNKILCVKNLT